MTSGKRLIHSIVTPNAHGWEGMFEVSFQEVEECSECFGTVGIQHDREVG
jgi:hypothetical protein